jgi:hypothetical protein
VWNLSEVSASGGCQLPGGSTYNIGKTGVMLFMLSFIKVLLGKDNPRDYRDTVVKRTTVTAIKYISINGRFLLPIIIWPATTY